MKHLLDLDMPCLRHELEAMGEKPYRAGQIASWAYQRGMGDFAGMSDLSAELRERLAREYAILTGKVVARTDSPDGVVKLLIEWPDSRRVECVLIPGSQGWTACVSTQVGCPMECSFCASGAGGWVRNLTGGEIVEQILHLRGVSGSRVARVVFMGMGEPLLNYEATLAAVHAIIDPDRMGLSARAVTISTVGLPKAIRRLAAEGLPVTLAISLHAPTDALRRQIMPKAATAGIGQIMAAAREFYSSRHREVTLEYVLLDGVNDSNVCAEALARLAMELRCNVNLIRYNPVPRATYKAPDEAGVRAFAQRLRRNGVNVQIRASKGGAASAACGQLRRQEQQPTSP